MTVAGPGAERHHSVVRATGPDGDGAGPTKLARRKVFMAHLLLAASLILVLVDGIVAEDERTKIMLRAASLFLLCLAALQLVTALPLNSRGIARWRVGPWYVLWSGVAFGLASMTWVGSQTDLILRITLPSVLQALTVFALSLVLWTIGYLVGLPRRLCVSIRRGLGLLLPSGTPELRSGAMPWILYGAGTSARIASVMLSGQFGYVGDASVGVSRASSYGQLLGVISELTVLAIATSAWRVFSHGRGRPTLWILVAVESGVGALGGMKEAFVLVVLAVLIPYGAVRARIPWCLIVIGVFAFLWIIIPFNTAYRQTVRTAQSSLSVSAAAEAAPEMLTGVLRSASVGDALIDSAATALRRVREIDNIAIILQKTPSEIPYLSPLEFLAAPAVGVIPRAVWPDKPVLATGYRFSQEYYGLSPNMYTSSAITPVGDLYRHGGWVVLVAGSLLLGAFYRTVDTVFRIEGDPRAIFFVLFFQPLLVKAEVDIYMMLVSVPVTLAGTALMARLIFTTRRGSSEAVRPAGA